MEGVVEKEVCKGKVLSLNWVSRGEVLTCAPGGEMVSWLDGWMVGWSDGRLVGLWTVG